MSVQFKEGREKCWGARDLYWQCLDSNDNKSEKCAKFRKEYEQFCSHQWVKHFDRKRNYEKFKENIENVGWDLPPDDKKKFVEL